MPARPLELMQGTLDMLVLKALAWEPRHGYAIMRWIRDTSGEDLQIEEGALYPALHRMHARGWIKADWGRSENNRRAKFYSLSADGKSHLLNVTTGWQRYSRAVGRVLEATQSTAP